jgi:LPS sulfotransferase NodH
MWHTGRCGSSVVADLVSRDGRIYWAGEILERPSNEWSGLSGGEALHRCRKAINRRRYEAGRSPFGFEMKLWHHDRLGLTAPDMYGLTTELGFGRHVVLERRNHLRQHVSGELAMLTGRYHRREGSQASTATLTVDIERVIRGADRYEQYHADLRAMLTGHLYLTYEDDIEADPSAAYAKVMRHCGIEPGHVTTDMRRTTARPLEDVIENFAEVADRLNGTRHEWMLGE